MNIFLWVLQALVALVYGASGVMKVFLFDKISGEVPSFGALPRQRPTAVGPSDCAWACGGMTEMERA
jgi:hypothetical protein